MGQLFSHSLPLSPPGGAGARGAPKKRRPGSGRGNAFLKLHEDFLTCCLGFAGIRCRKDGTRVVCVPKGGVFGIVVWCLLYTIFRGPRGHRRGRAHRHKIKNSTHPPMGPRVGGGGGGLSGAGEGVGALGVFHWGSGVFCFLFGGEVRVVGSTVGFRF